MHMGRGPSFSQLSHFCSIDKVTIGHSKWQSMESYGHLLDLRTQALQSHRPSEYCALDSA